jgi:glycosyltransferase involved in cell wall biosynthesis
VWPVDDARGASTRCRVLAHVGALSAAGLDVRVRFPLGLGARGVLRRAARLADLLRDTRGALDADLLLIHRKTYPPPFARRLAGRGVPVVFDFDDALHLPPPGARGAAADPERYRRNFAATIGLARLAICGNRELAGHVGSTPHVVIPTAVDTGRFNPEAFPPPVGKTLGWVGHPDNLPDLEALAEPLAELGRRHAGLRLVVVSGRAPRLRGVNVEFRRWSLDTEVSCFSGIAVALAPLRDTPWTRAKCAYKLLQYMALGIPAVATGVGMVREVVEDGRNAALASSPGEWVEAIDTLLRDRDLAARMGAAGRQTVVDRYSLEAVSPRLVAALEGALADRRAPSR